MPGAARQFEPQITRTGGVPSKFRYTARCSECPKTEIYEVSTPASDDLVKGYFSRIGWVLGRERAFDLCPSCLGGARRTRPSRPVRDNGPDLAAAPKPSDRVAAQADKRSQKIDDILARHLGKSAALAEEVFRPKSPPRPSPSAPEAPRQPGAAPALSPEVAQVLTGMAADLKSLRSTIELMAEQMTKLVAASSQQGETVARLAPLLAQSTEGLSSDLREIVRTVQSLSGSLETTVGSPSNRETAPLPEPRPEQDQEIRAAAEPIQAPEAVELPEPTLPEKKRRRPRQHAAERVLVKSIPDAKRPNRFYTTVRLPRELWDRSGFGPDERIQMDWSGKTLSITRVTDGGVKPKSVGAAVVVLQSWRLGDLNFDQAKVARGDASLRLTLSF